MLRFILDFVNKHENKAIPHAQRWRRLLSSIGHFLYQSPYDAAFYYRGDAAIERRKFSINGLQVLANPDDRVYANFRDGTETEYEPWVGHVIESRLPVGGVMLDIGANVGVHSLLGARCVGPTGTVFAVEGSPVNADTIIKNAQLNDCPQITLVTALASEQAEVLEFSETQNTSNQSVKGAMPDEILIPMDGTPTYSRRLACPLDTLLLPVLRRLDVIKIDVEGHENHVLRGMMGILRTYMPPIVAEYHKPLESRDYCQTLFALGYKAQVILTDTTLGPVCTSQAELDAAFIPVLPHATHCDVLFTR